MDCPVQAFENFFNDEFSSTESLFIFDENNDERQCPKLPQMPKDESKIFKCDYCDKRFSYLSKLIVHQEVHSHKLKFTCNHCGKGYKYLRSLKKHLKTHDGEQPMKCNWCPSRFSNKKELKIHTENHKFYKCDQCNQKFVWKSRLTTHKCQTIMHNDLKFFAATRKYNETLKRVWLCGFCDKYHPDINIIYDHTLNNHILCPIIQ